MDLQFTAQLIVVLLLLYHHGVCPGAAQKQQQGVACASDYCSIGAVDPYKGDIAGAGLRSALQACSYNFEVILLASTPDVLDSTLQLYSSLLQRGLAHQILLMPDEKGCDQALALLPTLCCVWSSLTLPAKFFQHQLLLWNVRRSMAARAVRLQYNILVLDSDVVVFEDPYRYLKAGPFKGINLMTSTETWPYEDNSLLNLGFLYAQGARPDGPVAAVLAEVPDRQLRFADDDGARLRALWGVETNCGTDEQLLFDDAVYGAVLGRPVSVVSMNMCGAATQQQHAANYTLVSGKYLELTTPAGAKNVFEKKTFPVPAEWRALVGADTTMIKTATLRWWQANGQWPMEYGGQLLPITRGPLSSAFQQLLRSECANSGSPASATGPGCPMWPDSEATSGATVVYAASSPQETFALAPPWLVASFTARGVKGLWGQHPGAPVQQVIGHIHQTYADAFIGKRGIMQYLQHYNWSLAHSIRGDTLFFASERSNLLPKVVALAPCINLGKLLRNLEDYKAILRGLAAVAALLGDRAILMPELPCSLSWVQAETSAQPTVGARGGGAGDGAWQLPLHVREGFMARGPLQGAGPWCTWQKFMIAGCVGGTLRALLPWEFEAYRQLAAARGKDTAPSPNNTIALLASARGQACIRAQRRPGQGAGAGKGGARLQGSGLVEMQGGQGAAGLGSTGARSNTAVAPGSQRGSNAIRFQQMTSDEQLATEEGFSEGGARRRLQQAAAAAAVGSQKSSGGRQGRSGSLEGAAQAAETGWVDGTGGAGGASTGGQAAATQGGSAVHTPAVPHLWEADAQDLAVHLLQQYKEQQVLYLRRPLLVDWRKVDGASPQAMAKTRFDAMLEACFSIKPDPQQQQQTLVTRKWSPTLLQ